MVKRPRLRMFAGPNGSGKSTIQNVIPAHLKGVYINPDDIERSAKDTGAIYFSDYSIDISKSAIAEYFHLSPLTKKASLAPLLETIIFEPESVKCPIKW